MNQTSTKSAIELLSSLEEVNKDIERMSLVPSKLVAAQNKKLSLIMDSLILSTSPDFPQCKELPYCFKGKFKTIGYYGKRQPLAKILYYFYNSLGDTIDFQMPEGNIYRSCGNTECYYPEHLVPAGARRMEMQKIRGSYKSPLKVDIAINMPAKAEEDIQAELEKQEQELFALFATKHPEKSQ